MPDNRWWSSFWMQSPIIGASLDPAESGSELDIMECFRNGSVSSHNVFTGGYGLDMKRAIVGGLDDLAMDQFHRFGMLWNENGYTFYVDGKEDGHIDQHVSKRPQFILISTEVQGYRRENHQPTPESYEVIGKDSFIVDYVRVFDLVK
jgi:beta-glucanase (GH16 family)